MKQKHNEEAVQKKQREVFNNVTQKEKVENQNQQHNVVQEGIGPVNQRR